MLTQRLTFGPLLILGLIAIFWADIDMADTAHRGVAAAMFAHGSIIPLAVMMLSAFGTLELLNLTRSAGFGPMPKVVLLGVLALHATAYILPALHPDAAGGPFEWQLIVLMLATLTVGLVQILRHRTAGGIGDISVSIMIMVYMGVLPSMIIALRAALPGTTGAWAVVLFIAVVKCTDIGAYFTGLVFGRTQLIPAISPGKTVEGFAGGFVLAILVAVALAAWLPWPTAVRTPISPTQAVLFGALIAGIGQLGDLMESIFKRDATCKDSGRVIPAFGGILDLLDSPVFAAPAAYLLLKTWLSRAGG